ncbi:tyrosine--tRNA ligase [Candidatus Saccharibacteria bacterium]|nr:tyrosine--tRNA ligase [Candidatus Saccharibacteria bacterium]
MTLSEELSWRGFVNQTTYPDITALDSGSITFYWGVDPSANNMTVGNLAMAMMVRHFVQHGHKAVLLVGGATGMIGDPDGKKQERDLLTVDQIEANKQAIAAQYKQVLGDLPFELVDNYDWFKDMNYLTFLREVGKHVPLRQMISRDFVKARLGDDGAGISYAEFSYSLIQGYDFLHLHQEKGVTLQVAGADQWGNSIAGVDLIRRVTGNEAHIWTGPLVVNKSTGVKFGKSEEGAIWLDPNQTRPFDFYQFWLNLDDEGVEEYLKYYTLLSKDEIDGVMAEFNANRGGRAAQRRLAEEVTSIVHGQQVLEDVLRATAVLFGGGELNDEAFRVIKNVFEAQPLAGDTPLLEGLVTLGLASSNTEARRFVAEGAITINGGKVDAEKQSFTTEDFHDGIAVVKRGKNSVAVATTD